MLEAGPEVVDGEVFTRHSLPHLECRVRRVTLDEQLREVAPVEPPCVDVDQHWLAVHREVVDAARALGLHHVEHAAQCGQRLALEVCAHHALAPADLRRLLHDLVDQYFAEKRALVVVQCRRNHDSVGRAVDCEELFHVDGAHREGLVRQLVLVVNENDADSGSALDGLDSHFEHAVCAQFPPGREQVLVGVADPAARDCDVGIDLVDDCGDVRRADVLVQDALVAPLFHPLIRLAEHFDFVQGGDLFGPCLELFSYDLRH